MSDRSDNIRGTIRGYASAHASQLVQVPVESQSPAEAVRVLQAQIFALTDAIVDLNEEIDQLRRSRR